MFAPLCTICRTVGLDYVTRPENGMLRSSGGHLSPIGCHHASVDSGRNVDTAHALPIELKLRTKNKGMEGLTVTPAGTSFTRRRWTPAAWWTTARSSRWTCRSCRRCSVRQRSPSGT